uniref:protein MOS2-like n=1 Tax=Erigeron canadensis TaxID=72917 RepID=UPI001CB8B7A0|nr:protein MOS2-like [Erigeron canadensis]
MKKLSFALQSSKPQKPSIKPSSSTPSSSIQKQFVTELDPSKTLSDPNSQNPNIIAPISNNWQPYKKPLDLPHKSDDPNLQFETSDSTVEPIDPNIVYSLNLRVKKNPNSDQDQGLRESNVNSGSGMDSLMLNRYRNDISKLPDDRGMDEFVDMRVEDFGAALLKGYGWVEGRGIGKNAKEDVKVVEILKRTGKEGLGFVNDMPMPMSKNDKESVPNGVKRDGNVGSGDINGKDKNLNVNQIDKNDGERKGSDRKVNDSRRDHKDENKDKKRSRDRYEYETPKKSWLNSRIRVRIISKELKGGKLYLQKGEIVDVVGPSTCDISMDSSREIVQGVEQDFLETVLPRCGGHVLVLYGRHKGVYRSLQENDMDNETAVVRDADTHALLNVKLEQIAEYVGDPDDIAY